MTSRGSREQNKTKRFTNIQISYNLGSLLHYFWIILKLQVMLASSKEIVTVGHGLCLQVQVEETHEGPLCFAQPGYWRDAQDSEIYLPLCSLFVL